MKIGAIEIAILMIEEAVGCVLEDYCDNLGLDIGPDDMVEVINYLKEVLSVK